MADPQTERANGSVDVDPVSALLAEFRALHAALHRAWTAAVGTPGYVKATWRDRDNALCTEYRDRLTALGYPRTEPMLAGGAR